MQATEAQPTTGWKSHDFDLGCEGFRFSDLNRVRRLKQLDGLFLEDLERRDPVLFEDFKRYRTTKGEGIPATELSWILVEAGQHFGRFVARLFSVEEEDGALREAIASDNRLFDWKKRLLNSRVLKRSPKPEVLRVMDVVALEDRYDMVVRTAFPEHRANDSETTLARAGLDLLDLVEATLGKFGRKPEGPTPAKALEALQAIRGAIDDDLDAKRVLAPLPEGDLGDREVAGALATRLLECVVEWSVALAWHPDARARSKAWATFRRPRKLDYEELVDTIRPLPMMPQRLEGPREHRRLRDGFDLTDERMERRDVMGEAHYCVLCHEREKDSCSTGFVKGDGYKKNPLGIPQTGCPLDEKISEAHMAKRRGDSIGALAIVMVNNPMCPGTGHRICNDCMKGCIFQKQEPVNIPEIETRILTDVLDLPYGVEIYGLLTRWNPLNPHYPVPRTYNGKNVLVVGMGPAGYTLAHHLLQAGFGVVGIDGLKVEPLPRELVGSRRRVPKPIRDRASFEQKLSERILRGFGGVSEYGITVRWDKNFLDLIYLTLARRKKFRLYDGVRFGGTLGLEDAWKLGFDHVAIAAGAGKPTIINMKNNLARGVRKASDLLMQMQLTGAFKRNSLVNLQVRLPAIVIGGGLTGVDTTTELLAYYPVQVEKTLERYEVLCEHIGKEAVLERLDDEDRGVLREQLAHGRAVRDERRKAWAERREPNLAALVRRWGGVTLVYRKRLRDSPAYRLNHEEVEKALEEGIVFVEQLSPAEVVLDPNGAAKAVRFERMARNGEGRWNSTGEIKELPARSVIVAAGTNPNTIYEREYPGSFKLDPRWGYFVPHKAVAEGEGFRLEACPDGEVGFFTSYESQGRFVTFYGDNHPTYYGNVVKAMASSLHGFHEIARLFEGEVARYRDEDQADREWGWVRFAQQLEDGLTARVVDVIRLTPKIVEIIVRAPFAAKNFKPGQFYRLQNYESMAPEIEGYRLTTEGIALTGAWTDPEAGLLSMIVLEMGHSSRLCAFLRPGEKIVVMGPTGTPTEIPKNETVMLVGGGLGNAVLFSIAAACKANGNRVLYFAGYKDSADCFKRQAIEDGTDCVIWCQDVGEPLLPRRPQDKSFTGNIVQAMRAYAAGELGDIPIRMCEVDRIVTIGSDRMMAAVKDSRRSVLKTYLKPDHEAIGSINSSMNCMMKEICAQCLQRHVDPETGKESFVFSCFNQDQPLDLVDFENLNQRLRQNSVAEKLSNLWLDYLISKRELHSPD
ncbi:MAG: FAD-dependent oxidoreductase [Planctomycetota bacterium]